MRLRRGAHQLARSLSQEPLPACGPTAQTLASYNAWYLIILGLVAIVVTLFARRGLWGLVDTHLNVRLFPVGYYLRLDEERPRRLRALPRRG